MSSYLKVRYANQKLEYANDSNLSFTTKEAILMEKDERMKLVNENGKTILMTKNEYLKLARQKGWDVKIPQLEDGTYDCDVFGGDNVHFFFGFVISGTLCLKDKARITCNVSARNGIILGNNASTTDLFSDNGDVILGDYADTLDITGRNVICGYRLYTNGCPISATDGFVILGKDANIAITDVVEISATEDIICADEP